MKLMNFMRNQFSEAEVRKLSDLINSPEGQRKLDEADRCRVEQRAERKQQLDSLNDRYDARIAAAGAKRWEAERNLNELRERTQRQIREAEEACAVAIGAVGALEQEKSKEEFDIKRELYGSRDVRIDEYYEHLSNALNKFRHLVQTWPILIGHHERTGREIFGERSNAKEVQHAMDLIKVAQKRVEEMALLPLTRVEIEERFISISRELAPTFQKFSQLFPLLNADGEVQLSTNLIHEQTPNLLVKSDKKAGRQTARGTA